MIIIILICYYYYNNNSNNNIMIIMIIIIIMTVSNAHTQRLAEEKAAKNLKCCALIHIYNIYSNMYIPCIYDMYNTIMHTHSG